MKEGDFMKTEMQYYADIANEAVNIINIAYDRMLIQTGKDEDTADDEADEITREVCDLSPYQLSDFQLHEYDPYEDYLQYGDGLVYDEAGYYKHIAYESVPELVDLFKLSYSILGYKGAARKTMALDRVTSCLTISSDELCCFINEEGDPYAIYQTQQKVR